MLPGRLRRLKIRTLKGVTPNLTLEAENMFQIPFLTGNLNALPPCPPSALYIIDGVWNNCYAESAKASYVFGETRTYVRYIGGVRQQGWGEWLIAEKLWEAQRTPEGVDRNLCSEGREEGSFVHKAPSVLPVQMCRSNSDASVVRAVPQDIRPDVLRALEFSMSVMGVAITFIQQSQTISHSWRFRNVLRILQNCITANLEVVHAIRP